jgi:hypothetical protein
MVALFASPRVVKVGVNLHGDTSRLAANFGVPVAAAHNVQASASAVASGGGNVGQGALQRSATETAPKKKKAKGGNASLEDLASSFCPPHLHVDKGSAAAKVRTGDWSAWPLSHDQARYAALDAVCSYWIFAGVLARAARDGGGTGGGGGAKKSGGVGPFGKAASPGGGAVTVVPGAWPAPLDGAALRRFHGDLELRDASPPVAGDKHHAAAKGGVNMKRAESAPGALETTAGGAEGDEGEADDDEDAAAALAKKEKANAAFFMMHRNKSIKPPNAGVKVLPEGPKDCLKKVVCIVSGVLDSMSRVEMAAYVERHGGTMSKAVTKKTTHLLNDHGEVKAPPPPTHTLAASSVFSHVSAATVP